MTPARAVATGEAQRRVRGWNPVRNGEFALPEGPGLGIELDEAACAAHPYRKNSFPSLWDRTWLAGFTQNRMEKD